MPSDAPPTPAPRRAIHAALRDPLVHFLAIGAAIFVASGLLAPERDDPRRMVIDDAVLGELVEIFADARERAPTREEMAALIDRWILNETLYREATSLGLHDGDEMIRERTMQKMRVLIQNAVIVGTPGAGELEAWFEANRARYDTPAQLSFDVARVDGDRAAAQAEADRLNAGDPGAAESGVVVYPFADRPRPGLVAVFGETFVSALESFPDAGWHPIESGDGWQVARVGARVASVSAAYASNPGRIASDWQAETFRVASTRAVEALIDAYDIRVTADYDPAAYDDLLRGRFDSQAADASDDQVRRR